MCVRVCVVFVASSLSCVGVIQWQPLFQSCCNPGTILTFVLSVIWKNKQSAVSDIYLPVHSQQKIGFSVIIFTQFFPVCLETRTILYMECVAECLFQCSKEKKKLQCISSPPSVIHLRDFIFFQELVCLCGDTHCQLRDGGRGGDVHQTRLSALHLGTVSKSCVSASFATFPLYPDSDSSLFSPLLLLPVLSFQRWLNHPFAVSQTHFFPILCLRSRIGLVSRRGFCLCLDLDVAKTSTATNSC